MQKQICKLMGWLYSSAKDGVMLFIIHENEDLVNVFVDSKSFHFFLCQARYVLKPVKSKLYMDSGDQENRW